MVKQVEDANNTLEKAAILKVDTDNLEDIDNFEDSTHRNKGKLALNIHTIDHSSINSKGYIQKEDTFQVDKLIKAQGDIKGDIPAQGVGLKVLVPICKTCKSSELLSKFTEFVRTAATIA